MLLARPARAPGTPRPAGAEALAHVSARRQVVEELLSGNPHIEKDSARSIADGAMMEAASVCVGQMVSDRPGRPAGGLETSCAASERPAAAAPGTAAGPGSGERRLALLCLSCGLGGDLRP